MIKRLRLFTLILIAIIWFIFILPYFLVQTKLGAKYTSQLISQYSDDYNISIEQISHSVTKPYEITLENIKISNKQQTVAHLSAKKLVLGLKQNDLWQYQSFDYILIENGEIETIQKPQVINSKLLQLKNVSLNYSHPESNTEIKLDNVYGSIKPWSTQFVTERTDSQFNITIQKAVYNQLNIQSIFIQGHQKDKTLRLTKVGGNINKGFFTAKINIPQDKSLSVEQLKINNLNFQSTMTTSNIDELLNTLPKTTIHQLSILNSSIEIPNFIVEKGNLEAKRLVYDNQLQLQKSDVTFSAKNIIWHEEIFDKPLIQWKTDGQSAVIEQMLFTWNSGDVNATGIWEQDQIVINSIIGSGLRYQLPNNWYKKTSNIHIPNNIPDLTIKQFILMPSLIIDTDPYLPFQFTALESFGHDINISNRDNKLRIDGTILLKADTGTLNAIELKKPDVILKISPTNKYFTFSALIDQGILEGNADLTASNKLKRLTLDSHAIDSNILSFWHLIENPIKTDKFSVTLDGQLSPLSVKGLFRTQGKNYPVENNKLLPH